MSNPWGVIPEIQQAVRLVEFPGSMLVLLQCSEKLYE